MCQQQTPHAPFISNLVNISEGQKVHNTVEGQSQAVRPGHYILLLQAPGSLCAALSSLGMRRKNRFSESCVELDGHLGLCAHDVDDQDFHCTRTHHPSFAALDQPKGDAVLRQMHLPGRLCHPRKDTGT